MSGSSSIQTQSGTQEFSAKPAPDGGAIDPVCGMAVEIATAKHVHTHAGTTYYFCAASCRTRFAADPVRYLDPDAKARADAAAATANSRPKETKYTCPMDPEVVQIGPGTCPKCGMALEPMGLPPVDAGPNPELVDFRHRFAIGAALALPLVVIAMAPHVGIPLGRWLPPHFAQLIELILATPVVLWCGKPFLERGLASIRNRSPNMWTLIAIGVMAAYLFSLVATLAPGIFPSALRGADGRVGLYFEAAAVIIVLVLAGQVLELKARERTGQAIRALLDLSPKTVVRISADGQETVIPLDQLRAGERVRIKPGAIIPADGVVVDGRSEVNESLLTGEAMPVDKAPGAKLTGGTLNGTGSLVMEAQRVGEATTLSGIVALVAEAQRTRAPIQGLADRVAAWFVPAVIAIAALAFVAWALFGPAPAIAHAIVAAVSVLIIACPCALGLATPMSIMIATGRGARSGILIRHAEALEHLATVNTLLVDKTGTLTAGQPRLTDVHALPGTIDEKMLLRMAGSLERGSEHPLAAAIVAGARERRIALLQPESFAAVPGEGATGIVAGQNVALGNAKLVRRLGLLPDPHDDAMAALRATGKTALYVIVGGRLVGWLALADTIKATTPAALAALRAHGIDVIMATGDDAVTAAHVANQLGIVTVHAGLSPADKARLVGDLKAAGRRVAMAGDGINDAPALSAADVGIAIGTGADVAIESAGITLLKGDLMGLARARRLAEATMRNIRQNLGFAFGYNALGIPVAAGVLYPILGFLLSPMIAAAAMSLSSVSVIANALRLNRADIDSD